MKPTPTLQKSLRRLALTTKQGPKDYYKGTGSGSMGRHTPNGGYEILWWKVRTYKCPDLKGFKVRVFGFLLKDIIYQVRMLLCMQRSQMRSCPGVTILAQMC